MGSILAENHGDDLLQALYRFNRQFTLNKSQRQALEGAWPLEPDNRAISYNMLLKKWPKGLILHPIPQIGPGNIRSEPLMTSDISPPPYSTFF